MLTKKIKKEGRHILFIKCFVFHKLSALNFCRLDTLRAGIRQPRSNFLKPVYSISE
jgi:hypothetical protein